MLARSSASTRGISRSPYGERGLKSGLRGDGEIQAGSLPVRGAWIEMLPLMMYPYTAEVAPRTGSVD